MDEKTKRKWIAELRNPNNRQCRFELRAADDAFCCLGILCNLVNPGGWQSGEFKNPNLEGHISKWRHTSNPGMPGHDVLEASGLLAGSAGRLSSMNDSGKSFAEIADYIEKNL